MQLLSALRRIALTPSLLMAAWEGPGDLAHGPLPRIEQRAADRLGAPRQGGSCINDGTRFDADGDAPSAYERFLAIGKLSYTARRSRLPRWPRPSVPYLNWNCRACGRPFHLPLPSCSAPSAFKPFVANGAYRGPHKAGASSMGRFRGHRPLPAQPSSTTQLGSELKPFDKLTGGQLPPMAASTWSTSATRRACYAPCAAAKMWDVLALTALRGDQQRSLQSLGRPKGRLACRGWVRPCDQANLYRCSATTAPGIIRMGAAALALASIAA